MMMALAKKVWELWDDLPEMASDLGESINALRRAQESGGLPDPRHDRGIVIRARALGKHAITLDALTRARAPRGMSIDKRREIIRALVEAAGGYQAVSDRTGTSVAHLYVALHRARLNGNNRRAYLKLAKKIGFELPPEIFNRPE